MGINKKKLNREENLNEKMNLFGKDEPESKTENIRKIIDDITDKWAKLLLKYEADTIKGINKTESIVDFMRFSLEDVQKGLKKINDLSYEIEKESISKQES